MISYTVRCRFDVENREIVEQWLDWLDQTHIEDVKNAGAISAEIFEMDAESPTFEIRYQFACRDAFLKYEREMAPELRRDGLQKFPLELGLDYSRTVGQSWRSY